MGKPRDFTLEGVTVYLPLHPVQMTEGQRECLEGGLKGDLRAQHLWKEESPEIRARDEAEQAQLRVRLVLKASGAHHKTEA